METALGLAMEDALRELLPEGHEPEKIAIERILDSVLFQSMHIYATELEKLERQRKKRAREADAGQPKAAQPKMPTLAKSMKSDFQVVGSMQEYKSYLDTWEIDVKDAQVMSAGIERNQATPTFKTVLRMVERTSL
ncbi:hypothetical protein SPRG_19603 [Saprolegnia parasitica CBS 223.65]|uniref:Uncharacterized protein n=1 Tax=Saprolegnia parasitica (strain CBS 223.65) TaxID=695850 RepID=A0A067CWB1_SAPPC|nr:hypothetical protein SPRG_19603 [Saprolegnia parasitica CBS 223.65]KDO31082.1 hypothetical protein SPRG_19603 [Saprolegnia parasitica CBS 223.65]|eukprot:XP_012198335.1 hypothetical protein SPRG_19603 [Saprolegnia parasitica CBS 223.65]